MSDLQIFLITYNRKQKLQFTIDALLKSPVANYDIVVLDNASTDGTSELLDDYASKHKNITHIRHKINIGGNANICRAFEMAASCGKKYAWILCDDDKYDFSNWDAVENAMTKDYDAICVSDYVFPNEKSKSDSAYQIFQMTFVPATIFKTSLITSGVLMNMYDAIYTMFQQTCLTAHIINNNGSIIVLDKPIVFNGYLTETTTDISYTRGTDNDQELLKRRRDTIWILGFCNVLSLLKDKKLREKCISVSILDKSFYTKWNRFYKVIFRKYFNHDNKHYFREIFLALPSKKRFQMFLYSFKYFIDVVFKFIFSVDKDDSGKTYIRIFGIKIYKK